MEKFLEEFLEDFLEDSEDFQLQFNPATVMHQFFSIKVTWVVYGPLKPWSSSHSHHLFPGKIHATNAAIFPPELLT